MKSSAYTFKSIMPGKVIIPGEHLLELPEKVLQFATGILLRVLPHYFIDTVQNFINKVPDRFRNPHINHHWKSITLNYSSKMKLRCIPLLINYYRKNNPVPELSALGFASYIYFMKAAKQSGNEFLDEFNSEFYLMQDDMAEKFCKSRQNLSPGRVVQEVLRNVPSWDKCLGALQGFKRSVTGKLNSIINNGMRGTLENVHPKKTKV